MKALKNGSKVRTVRTVRTVEGTIVPAGTRGTVVQSAPSGPGIQLVLKVRNLGDVALGQRHVEVA